MDEDVMLQILSSQKAKVLFVDDEPRVLRSLKAVFRKNYQVFTAESADQAKSLMNNSNGFDVVVTDERMPSIPGHKLLEWVKNHSPDTGRILLSGVADEQSLADAMAIADTDIFLPKPWNTEKFIDAIENAVTSKQASKRAHPGASKLKSIAFIESNENYQRLYNKLSNDLPYVEAGIAYKNQETFLSALKAGVKPSLLIIDLSEDLISIPDLLAYIAKNNPELKVILTAEPQLARYSMSSINSRHYFDTVIKPVSSMRMKPLLEKALL